VRLMLGVVESGFFPGILLYMSMWYRRHELARRFSFFFAASLIAGAFGGLIAGGIVTDLEGARGLPSWKWLFLVEGLMTMVFAVSAVFIMPDFPGNTRWLSEEERRYAVGRLIADHTAVQETDTDMPLWKAAKVAVLDWRMWLFTFGQTCNSCAGTISYFIPTLVSSLGYEGNMAQFMTVPIYSVAVVVNLIVCFSSDIYRERPKHEMFLTALGFVSLAIVAGVTEPKVRYAFLCLGVSGVWASGPLTLVWGSSALTQPPKVRAIQIGLLNGLANLSSTYGSYVWPASSAPRYIPGFVTCVMLMVAAFGYACIGWYFIPGSGARLKLPYELEEERAAAPAGAA